MQNQTAADIPEAIDLGEDPREAVGRLIDRGEYSARELGRDIAEALVEPCSANEIIDLLQRDGRHPRLQDHLMLETVRAEDYEGASEAARWVREGRQRKERPAPLLPAPADQAERRRRRELRLSCRQNCRNGDIAALLLQIGAASHLARTAADLLVREELTADLLAHTAVPPEPLAVEMYRRNMLLTHNRPAPLRGHTPSLLAVRLRQAAESGHSTRWLHRIHPVLWVVGHRPDGLREEGGAGPEATGPESSELLGMLPAAWLATAAHASEQSKVNTQQMLRQARPGSSGEIASALLPSWNGNLQDLIEVAEKLSE